MEHVDGARRQPRADEQFELRPDDVIVETFRATLAKPLDRCVDRRTRSQGGRLHEQSGSLVNKWPEGRINVGVPGWQTQFLVWRMVVGEDCAQKCEAANTGHPGKRGSKSVVDGN